MVAAAGGLLWVFGGKSYTDCSPDSHCSQVHSWDPVRGLWTAAPDMPAQHAAGAAVAVDHRIFLLGGGEGGLPATARVDVFDTRSMTWSRGPDLPAPRAFFAAVADGPILYVLGGIEGAGKAVDTAFALDTGTGTWRTLALLPAARIDPVGGVCGDGIYLMGADLATRSLSTQTWRYDPRLDLWDAARTPAPMEREAAAKGAVAFDGRIHLAGGFDLGTRGAPAGVATFTCGVLPAPPS